MPAKFEVVSKYKDAGLPLPVRATGGSAGYDFVVAEDIIIPTYDDQYDIIFNYMIDELHLDDVYEPLSLDDMAKVTKATNTKFTLVSTGMKCKLDPGTYLELSVRSSCPLKHWLILANGVGIIDADYYNNVDNEGEIFFQMINLGPMPIYLKKGDKIGQGIIKPYLVTEDDNAIGTRTGGLGSTSA